MALATACGIIGFAARSANATFVVDPPVTLQSTIPGVVESGSINVSGVIKGGALRGNGSGITALKASSIASDLLNDARLSPNVALGTRLNTFTAVQRFTKNLLMTSQNGTILFPAVTIPTAAPMMTMFASGTSNQTRMVLAHSPSFENWGLQYEDVPDIFNFLAGGVEVFTVDLGSELVGVGNGSPSAKLDVVAADAIVGLKVLTSGTASTATLSNTNAANVSAVQTITSNGIGSGITISLSNGSNGARGIDVSQSGVGPGVFSTSTGGNAVWGIASSVSAAGVIGDNTDGEVVVGRGNSSLGGGVGAVVGRQDGDLNYGVRGFVTGDNAIGVLGQTGISGGVDGYAVRGNAVITTNNAIGVYGSATGATQYGVFSNGRTGASGTKSFVIDHPDDPRNKMLIHYSAEGDQPLNAYSGNIQTDSTGTAWVTVPQYVEEINRDFRYQLTVMKQFAQAIVSEELDGGKFQIKTDKPNVKVSWRLEGVRNDAFVKKYGAPIEVEKRGQWAGKYLIPDLYNAPVTQGIDFLPSPSGLASSQPAANGTRKSKVRK